MSTEKGHSMSTDHPQNVPTEQRGGRPGAMVERSSLRLSATLMLSGQLLFIVVTLFHALTLHAGPARWGSRFGAASMVVALALYAVLQAVDGVGNKMVDAAWVSAPDAEKSARFASAEAM